MSLSNAADRQRSLVVTGATVIDTVTERPREDCSIWIEGARIRAVGPRAELGAPPSARGIDARGKFVIPGLMNANVHLLADVRVENLARYEGRWEDLIIEAAQVALRSGLTTVFDTWGPREPLMTVREKINAGRYPGARIYCAGNIIGLDGPLSEDFLPKAAEVASAALAARINASWVENVGRRLMWLPRERVASEVRAYIRKGLDFIKYAANDHMGGAFLCFSAGAQSAIVEEAHSAGITAQAHTMSVEGLQMAVEAGCDLIQHANITGPELIPDRTLKLMSERKTAAAVFAFKSRVFEWIMQRGAKREPDAWTASDANVRRLIKSDAPILFANDAALFATDALTDSSFLGQFWAKLSAEDCGPYSLSHGHFEWFEAMEEKGFASMQMLRAATSNIARAYGVSGELGTLEPGKIADFLILDKDPLRAAENYRSISAIVKEGVVIDRSPLPLNPVLSRAGAPGY